MESHRCNQMFRKACENGLKTVGKSKPLYSEILQPYLDSILEDSKFSKLIAYVDGSYNSDYPELLSCGIVFLDASREQVVGAYSNCRTIRELIASRNVGAEIYAACTAVNIAVANGCKNLVIYHDYAGLRMWPDGEWAARNPVTQRYTEFIQDKRRNGIVINFIKVTAHSGNRYNELADSYANGALLEKIKLMK